MATELTSLPRVKAYANLDSDESDAIISSLIKAVSARIETRCRRTFGRVAVATEYYDHRGNSDRLQLRNYPIVASPAPTVEIDAVAISASDFSVEDYARAWLVYHPDGDPADWPEGRRHITVSYTYGYSEIPEDLIDAATVQVVWQFNRTGHRGSRLGSRTTESAEGATATWMVDAWAPDVRDVIELYSRDRRI